MYGKLFAAHTSHFGPEHIPDIEDAIQDSFLKLVKIWHATDGPDQAMRWLFRVSRNQLLNTLKREKVRLNIHERFLAASDVQNVDSDQRLRVLTWIAQHENLTNKAKVSFVLKNIFGLNVQEISQLTIQGTEAIYKEIQRVKRKLRASKSIQEVRYSEPSVIPFINQVIYGVFSTGIDIYNAKNHEVISEDLCLEALALAKQLFRQTENTQTSNILSIFCFHLALVASRKKSSHFIPLLEQSSSAWDKEFIHWGLHYLAAPDTLDRYYLQALILSKHILDRSNDNHWQDVIELYKLLSEIDSSPIVQLNYAFCMYQAGHKQASKTLLESVRRNVPENHFYYLLVLAETISKEHPKKARELFAQARILTNKELLVQYLDQKIKHLPH